MVFDSNLIIRHVRRYEYLPARAIIPVVVMGEIEAFALKSDWGYQKVAFTKSLFERYPVVEIIREMSGIYSRLDAYSQGKLRGFPLPPGLSARNMGKNDLWIAATAMYLDLELHTTDDDFDHLPAFGLKLVKA